ncbi:MAG: replicative DNA helicase [Veillonella sp.]|nr:replicative DNA helicase [Veillonella sp.]
MDVRVPPHNIEAEQAVLGALLTSDTAADSVTNILKASDFYRDAHRIIYDALLSIIRKNKKADMILLTEELDRLNKLETVGGIAYISSLTEQASSYNVEEHARIVADKAKLRALIDVGNKVVGMSYAGDEEPQEIINEAERMVLDVSGQTNSESTFSRMGEVVMNNLNRLSEIQQQDGTITGLSTDFRDLDKITSGLQKSDLILVAARPAMGKTAFTLNLAQNISIKYKKSVAFFSLEMSKEQLVGRILSSVSEVSSEKLRVADLDDGEWNRIMKAAEVMDSAPLYIDDTPGLTVQMMRSKLRRLKVEHGLDLVIVDYIQLMQGSSSGRQGENRQQEISEISRNLKLIAREFNVPVIALSQLSRSVEQRPDKRPVLSDLRESGSLEQDADIVVFLYRDKYYDENSEKGDITEVIIRKHRSGSLGTVELVFQGELTRFRDVAYREEA